MRLIALTKNLTSLFVGLVLTALGIRFVLKLFGANDSAAFVGWIYDMTAVLLEPFRGIFTTQTFENTYVFEFATLFAMVVYGLLGMLLAAAITALTPVTSKEKKKR